MAFPTFGALKDFAALGDRLLVIGRAVGGQAHDLAGLARVELGILEFRRETHDIRDHRPTLGLGQAVLDPVVIEGLHAGAGQAPTDRAEQVFRQGKLAALRGAELEGAEGEIAWPRVHIGRRRPLAVAQQAVAETAAPDINLVALRDEFVGDLGHGAFRHVRGRGGRGWPGCQGNTGGQA